MEILSLDVTGCVIAPSRVCWGAPPQAGVDGVEMGVALPQRTTRLARYALSYSLHRQVVPLLFTHKLPNASYPVTAVDSALPHVELNDPPHTPREVSYDGDRQSLV